MRPTVGGDVDPTIGADIDPTVGGNVDTNVDGIPSASLIDVFPSIYNLQ